MDKIYCDLIKKGLKTLEDVPENLRDKVEELLKAEVENNDWLVTLAYK